MIHVTCRLTDKKRDQLRNPALGNRLWATFTFFTFGLFGKLGTMQGQVYHGRELDAVDQ